MFIRIAEERILKNVQLSLFRKNATASTTASNKFLACPSDFLAPFSLSLAGTDGDKFFIDFKDPSFIQTYTPDATTTGSPKYYTFDGIDNNGDTKVRLYPEQDKTYTLRFDVVKRQADLSVDGDTLLIPAQPVIHLAVALLARERGETGGTSTAEYFAIADKYLSDAIAIDAAKHPEEMIFRTI